MSADCYNIFGVSREYDREGMRESPKKLASTIGSLFSRFRTSSPNHPIIDPASLMRCMRVREGGELAVSRIEMWNLGSGIRLR